MKACGDFHFVKENEKVHPNEDEVVPKRLSKNNLLNHELYVKAIVCYSVRTTSVRRFEQFLRYLVCKPITLIGCSDYSYGDSMLMRIIGQTALTHIN